MKPVKPSSKIFLLTVPRLYFCGSFVLFMSCDCHAFASRCARSDFSIIKLVFLVNDHSISHFEVFSCKSHSVFG